MYVITQNQKDNRAVIITDILPTMEENQTIVGNKIYGNIGTSNSTLYSDVTVPEHVKQGLYAFDGTEWTVHAGSVPREVTMEQAQLAMLDAGILADVEAAIANDPRAQIRWKYATKFQRDDEMVVAIAAALGMTDAQIDELFIAASLL